MTWLSSLGLSISDIWSPRFVRFEFHAGELWLMIHLLWRLFFFYWFLSGTVEWFGDLIGNISLSRLLLRPQHYRWQIKDSWGVIQCRIAHHVFHGTLFAWSCRQPHWTVKQRRLVKFQFWLRILLTALSEYGRDTWSSRKLTGEGRWSFEYNQKCSNFLKINRCF